MTKLDLSTAISSISGKAGDLSPYEGKVMLVVNTASKCGLTPQFEGLEALHKTYADQGLAVLGFPCNQFAGQDPGENAEIAEFCQLNYGVSFPMHEKVNVNGKDTHPLFEQLKKAAPGALGTKAIKWNFTKFLVGRDGTILKRFAPKTAPDALRADIEAALGAGA